ncbi:hypothetical protein D9M72_599490 [compost metagenome]
MRASRTALASVFSSLARRRSEKPFCFRKRSSAVDRLSSVRALTRPSVLMMSSIWARNQGSMSVSA